MNRETLLTQEDFTQNKYSKLLCLFGLGIENMEDIPKMDFFEFLEFTYKKLQEKGELKDSHPFYQFLEKLSQSFLQSYIALKKGYPVIEISSSLQNDQKSSELFQRFVQEKLRSSPGRVSEIFFNITFSRVQIKQVLQNISKTQDEIGDIIDQSLQDNFQEFVKNVFQQNERVFDDENIEEACYFYLNGEYYGELSNIAGFGIKNFIENPIYLYYAGVAEYFLENNDEAKKYFSEFLEYSHEDVETQGYLAMIELQELLKDIPNNQQKLQKLAEKIQEIIEKNSEEPNYNIFYVGAIINYNVGSYVNAVAFFEKIFEIDSNDEANFAYLAASYERSGQPQNALDLLLSREEEYKNDEEFQESIIRLTKKIKEEIL